MNIQEENNKKTCFVITPIGNEGSVIRRKIEGVIKEVIEPILNKLNYEVIVSHRISESGSVTRAIIQHVYNDDLVIANLTGNNPNVMYEVALRHASGKPIIHITENVADLPFDINDHRAIEYSDDMAGAHKLKEDLREMVIGVKFDEIAENPITIALEKRNLTNIPEGTSTAELSEILYQLKDDINVIARDMSLIKKMRYSANTSYRKTGEQDMTQELLVRTINDEAARIHTGKKIVQKYIGPEPT